MKWKKLFTGSPRRRISSLENRIVLSVRNGSALVLEIIRLWSAQQDHAYTSPEEQRDRQPEDAEEVIRNVINAH